MSEFAIMTDTCSNLPDEVIDTYNLQILPLRFMVDGETYQSYLKGQTSNLQRFYTMMRDGKIITTTLPSLEFAKDLSTEILESGKDLLYIGFSSALSGTFQAIALLLDQLKETYPERSIYYVDSLCASGGQGLLVRSACELCGEGRSIEEVHTWCEQHKRNVIHWFTVDDLKYLVRGGRVSRTAGFAGQMLNIKPVLNVTDAGALAPQIKVRGRKKSMQTMVDEFKKTASQPLTEQRVIISHGDCIEDAQKLATMLSEQCGVHDCLIGYVDPVIGAHSGPGTLTLFYYGTSRAYPALNNNTNSMNE